MAEHRAGARGRRMGSSRRRQLRKEPGPGEEPPWASEVMQRVQGFIREHRRDQEGFITRSDMQKLQEEDFPCSTEELELLFDGLDAAGTGRLSTEEFTAGLRQFLSSQKTSREHRRRKTASRRSCLVLASPTLEEMDSEERKHFAAFMDQLGTDDISEEQEIGELWAKLRKEEPQLLGNLEDFLAKMRHRIQEARSKKVALEAALNKRVAEHDREVQRLCTALEQQIQQEQQRLEHESTAQSHLRVTELQRALDASEREVRRLVAVQEELETRCRSLRSTQQAASTENRQLEESNRVLEEQLQHIHVQLQQTHERLRAAVAREQAEEPQDRVVVELPGETTPSPLVLQMNPEQSEKYRSEMRTRLGSQGGEPKRRSTHHVVWEKLPVETSISGPPSVEEDPFPEFLKEERFSDQGSLLREMNDAIAALSTQKPQAPADTARCPQDDAEPQTGPEAAAPHGSAPRETRVAHEVFDEDLREGRAAAEHHARDVTQAGASTGAVHSQEQGAEQGESPERAGQGLEEVERMLSVQGKGTGGKEQIVQEAEHSRESLGADVLQLEAVLPAEMQEGRVVADVQQLEALSRDAGVQLLAELGEIRASSGGSTEAETPPLSAAAALGAELADSMGPDVQPLEEADRAEPGLEEEGPGAAVVLGGGLSPAETPAGSPALGGLVLPSAQALEWEEAGDSQVDTQLPWGGGDHAAVQIAQEDEGKGGQHLEEERDLGEMQEGGTDEKELGLVSAQNLEEAEGSPAETLLCGGPSSEAPRYGRDHAAVHLEENAEDRGRGLDEPGLPDQPVCDPQGAGAGQPEGAAAEVPAQEEAESLELLEAPSTDTGVQLLAELGEIRVSSGGENTEAEMQPLSAADALGAELADSMGPDVQPLEEADRAEPGLEEEGPGAAVVLGGGLSPAETPAGSPALGGLVLPSAQALEWEEAGDSQVDTQLPWGSSKEVPWGGGDHAAVEIAQEDEGQGVQHLEEERELGEMQEGGTDEELGLVNAEALEEAEDSHVDTQLCGSPSPETARDGGDCLSVHLWEGAEVVGQGGQHLEEERELGEMQEGGTDENELGLVNAEALEVEEAESLVQLEELSSSHGESTDADLKPLGTAGVWEGAESQSVALEAALCMPPNTCQVWDGDADARALLPGEAALHPEHAAAAKHPHPDAMLVAASGPHEQILEETQALEIPQGECSDAKGRPLDRAEGLQAVQGARLEAEARILVDSQHLQLMQGPDASAATLTSPVSEVPLRISTLNLDTVMQEDVLVPDVQRLGGQAAPSELQEQVSAQAGKGRLHTAPQRPQEEPPGTMEARQAAAGPAEPPEGGVPPAPALHTRTQQEEGDVKDLLGMVLGDSPLADAASSRLQPQKHLSGERKEDLDVGQLEKNQEIKRKVSQEGEPRTAEPGAVTANGAGAAPKGSPEASLEPDHLYNVLFVGDSHVGKTSFLYRLHADAFNPHLAATVGLDYQVKNLVVDNKRFALRLWDSAGQERYHSITKQFFRKADGVVLMYDVTSQYSFADVRYWLSCIQEGAEDGVTVLLLGNKTDCAAERQVPTQEGERLAAEHQLLFYECSAASGHNVTESIVSLIRSLKVREDQLRKKAEEVPKLPQKKKGCCW